MLLWGRESILIWTLASAASAFEDAPSGECQLAPFNYSQIIRMEAHLPPISFLCGQWGTDVVFLSKWHFHQTLRGITTWNNYNVIYQLYLFFKKEIVLYKQRLKKIVPSLHTRAIWDTWLGCQTGFSMISQCLWGLHYRIFKDGLGLEYLDHVFARRRKLLLTLRKHAVCVIGKKKHTWQRNKEVNAQIKVNYLDKRKRGCKQSEKRAAAM